jgi:hypothetical protein
LPFLAYLDLLVYPDRDSHPEVLYDPQANIQFLLRCQSSQWGGIARSPGDHPGERSFLHPGLGADFFFERSYGGH